MKNIMIIDGADNCAYDIFAATNDEFGLFFPADGQDIAFIDEIWRDDEAPPPGVRKAFEGLFSRPVEKTRVDGIHGTIFYQLNLKKQFYPNRLDRDLTDNHSRPWRQGS